MPNMIYRSPLTRWILAAVGVAAGLTLTFGNQHQWRSTPSLHWLAGYGVPLQVWGCVAFVYAAMLLTARFRALAFVIGAGLFALFTISLIATVGDGAPKNAVAIAAMIDVTVFHIYSIRTALVVVDAERAHRK